MIINNKGTMPVWVAILGTLAVLGTITGTQRIMQGFLVSQSDHAIKTKYDSAIDWAINLGAYLVTNNLVLCRSIVWSTTDNNRCKWNTKAPTPNTPADFSLSNQTISNGKLSYDLSTPDDVDFNLSEKIKITFNLAHWDLGGTGELKKIIGDIPGGFCRNSSTKVINKTCKTCASNADCGSGVTCDTDLGACSCCSSGETFEAISSVDKDYNVVLVEVVAGAGTSNQTSDYVGVRRPMSRLILSFEKDLRCALKCDVGSVASSSASCRSALKAGQAKVKVKVFNQGPGVLYNLHLLREARMRRKLETCTTDSDCRSGSSLQECDAGVCVGRTIFRLRRTIQNLGPPSCTTNTDCHDHYSSGSVTCTNNKCVTIGAILPGEFFYFTDHINCENSNGSHNGFPKWDIKTIREKLIEINNDTASTTAIVDALSQNVNVYSEKIMKLEYKVDLTTKDTFGTGNTAKIVPARIFHHGNTVNLPDGIATTFMMYEPPN